jgi:GNAT superfamily N-acetyltransferase
VADGYPAVWPTDPAGWLSPAGLVGAWVVEQDGALCGHVSVVRPPVPEASPGGQAEVSRLFVAPAARGQQLGAALLTTASSWADAQGLGLSLEVVDDAAPAAALYERLGWRLVERRPATWMAPTGHRPLLRVYRAPNA